MSVRITMVSSMSSTLPPYLFDVKKNIRDVKETGCTDTILTARQFHKVGYEDAKTWMERRVAAMKSGVSNWAATAIAGEWQSSLSPDLTDLNEGIAEIKAANLARHYARWHVPHLGSMEQWRPDSTFRFLVGQLNSASSTEVRTRKVEDLLWLINIWEVQGGGLSEVGVNWGTYPSSANLASWFKDKFQTCAHTQSTMCMRRSAINNQGGLQPFCVGNLSDT